MPDHYFSLSDKSEGSYREKGSKFLAYAYSVSSETEVQQHLADLKKLHHTARHHCYAFVLKPQPGQEETYRASDDGEPPHSAGDPILGQIRSYRLLDVLVVVVRYFGGTKLGVAGLINAYKTAAADALSNSVILEKYVERTISVEFDYAATSAVMKIIDHYSLTIIDQAFTEICYYYLSVRLRDYEAALAGFSALEQVKVKH
ncbi:IMPACT family protein [Tunicatimonas pelagia]|uniref:IMPACT family protein n=1 Tax=Tunicatimonas pelagia TaxID=931531 RepID=UPI002665F311|nr:YigZ family protein [Tunicatimonas pelagia]WKN45938.1 YigZ family protein [Tunicatimonas pelagia]